MISKSRSIAIIIALIICLGLGFSMMGCKGEAGPLEDMPDQVNLSRFNESDRYTYPGSTLYLSTTCDKIDKLPEKPVYVWTVLSEGNIIDEIIHDKLVKVRHDDYYDEDAEDEEDEWPCTDEIKYEFLQEGTYNFRIDLYDNDEYKTLGNLAPRYGTITKTVHCEAVRISLTATPTGESREYTFTAKVENKNVLGLYAFPKWKFLQWTEPGVGALHDDGKTEKYSEEDDMGFDTGVHVATHQFQQDGKYRIVFSLTNEKDNEFAKTDIALDITGVELAIRVPTQPLKTGQEYTFTAQNDYPEKMPESPVYEWDFGDNNGIVIPFSNEATHLYEEAGTYTVRVGLFNSGDDAAPLLGVATAQVTVEAAANHLIELHQMNKFSLDFAVQHDYVGGQSGIYLWDFNSHGEVIWDGINFSMQWQQDGHSEIMTGRVSEDGMMIEQLKIRHEFGDTEWYELEIQNLPFWTDTMPDRFIVEKSDEDVQDYVVYFNTYRTAGYHWNDDASLYVRFEK